MTSMNISLPDSLKVFVEEQVAKGGYSSTSEYLRELIRQAQKEQAREKVEALLLEGLQGEAVEVTDDFWKEIRREVEERRRNSGNASR